jgi:hypothetical protein
VDAYRALGQLIVVNIPEFILHVYEGKQKAFDMNVVVGKEGHNTVSFSGDLSTIVFSPLLECTTQYCKRRNTAKLSDGYLESQNMEQVGTEGRLPVIRQKPGLKTPWVSVKFLFPTALIFTSTIPRQKACLARIKELTAMVV